MARTARRFASRRESSHLPASEAWIQIGGWRNSGSCFDMQGEAYVIPGGFSISRRPTRKHPLHLLRCDHHEIKRMLRMVFFP
jgi:hypothetical protein